MQKQAVQFTKKPYLPLFLSETADKFARDYAIKKSFRHALHLVTAHLHRQNQVAHALRTRDFWLASLSIDFPIHFARRAHEYPVTLMSEMLVPQHDCISLATLQLQIDTALYPLPSSSHLQNVCRPPSLCIPLVTVRT